MQLLALLSSVAAGLPGEHRPRVPGRQRCLPGLRQPPEAVHHQGPRQQRQPERQHREDEQLVPQDVPAIGLPGQPPRRDADVEVGGVRRDRLQQVQQVQSKHPEGPRSLRHLEVALLPQVRPGKCLLGEQVAHPCGTAQPPHRLLSRLADGVVAAGVDGHDLLRGHRLALL